VVLLSLVDEGYLDLDAPATKVDSRTIFVTRDGCRYSRTFTD
jgi:hypothetical protein